MKLGRRYGIPFDNLIKAKGIALVERLAALFKSQANQNINLYDTAPTVVPMMSLLLSRVPDQEFLTPEWQELIFRLADFDWLTALDAVAFTSLALQDASVDNAKEQMEGVMAWLLAYEADEYIMTEIWKRQRGCALYNFEAVAKAASRWRLQHGAILTSLALLKAERQALVPDRYAISFKVFETILPTFARVVEAADEADLDSLFHQYTSLIDTKLALANQWDQMKKWSQTIYLGLWSDNRRAKTESTSLGVPFSQLISNQENPLVIALAQQFSVQARSDIRYYDQVPLEAVLASILIEEIGELTESLQNLLRQIMEVDIRLVCDALLSVALGQKYSPDSDSHPQVQNGISRWLSEILEHPIFMKEVWMCYRGPVLLSLEAVSHRAVMWSNELSRTHIRPLLDLMVTEGQYRSIRPKQKAYRVSEKTQTGIVYLTKNLHPQCAVSSTAIVVAAMARSLQYGWEVAIETATGFEEWARLSSEEN